MISAVKQSGGLGHRKTQHNRRRAEVKRRRVLAREGATGSDGKMNYATDFP